MKMLTTIMSVAVVLWTGFIVVKIAGSTLPDGQALGLIALTAVSGVAIVATIWGSRK